MKQQIEVTTKLTFWIDAQMDQEEIGVYCREGLYKGFEDQAEFIDGNTMVDILEIKEEAEIFGNDEKPLGMSDLQADIHSVIDLAYIDAEQDAECGDVARATENRAMIGRVEKLMLAAPDLLEAAQELVEFWNGCGFKQDEHSPIWGKFNAAIAKAKGEQSP